MPIDSNGRGMLCEACQKIFRGRQILSAGSTTSDNQTSQWNSQAHQPSLQSFLKASDLGCPVCYEFRSSIGEARLEIFAGLSTSNEFSYWVLERREGGGYDLNLALDDDYDELIEYRLSLDLEVLPPNIYDGPTENNSLFAGGSTDSDAAWAQAFRWYQACLSMHTACNSSSHYLPSRLLSLSEDDPGVIRLVATKVERKGIYCYATLSHCWGDANILKLQSSTLDAFQQGISLSLLPKTFVEAIAVSRRFSIPYLWIDSLCIIQDSVADWRAEAASMEDVYSNSRLNIMATASRNSHEGLFRSRDPKHLALCIVESQWTDAANDRFSIVQDEMWRTEMTNAPLNQRGWVLQERILPPRALHYGQHQLLWECRELDACEKYPTGLPKSLRNIFTGVKITDPEAYQRYHYGWYSRDGGSVGKGERLKKLIDYAYMLWDRWILVYSSMQFTRYSDRLIAFSGLANRMRAILQDEYHAGLWQTRFADELLWFTYGDGSIEDEFIPYRPPDGGAPSWSWASVTGKVATSSTVDFTGKAYHLDLKAVNVTPVSGREGDDNNDDTGAILDGQVRIRGFLKRGTLLKNVYHMPEEDYEAPATVYSVEVDGIEPVIAFVDEPMVNWDTMKIVVLPVLTNLKDSDDLDSKEERLHALLLRRQAGLPKGFYARVGYVSGTEKEFSSSQLRDFFHDHQTATSTQGKEGGGTGFRNALRKLVWAKEPRGSGASWPKLGDEKLYLSGAHGEFIIV
ncbi:hypothetical protein FVEN_g8270 [Fusarium venenatum]|uniref:Heterokaryon incompatibility domain-containing protein n=1 Tax=Fusarium venenatum TaxID=56646 RepID=A0A2L2SS75_9HYPO|nr:uncharacterized protein FVRRES_04360 [Fusarium venenatum]KAG8353981.1 hypothetical protein FVEN_g8270 [Fusarium venenatum]CEI59924.1 unnamed protein product [Fusarium venenatum]